MRTTRFAWRLALMLSLPLTALAGPITYDFLGSVTFASGTYGSVPTGATVSGTFTFDFANADPNYSSGSVGSPSPWTAQIFGGSFYLAHPTPVTEVVFSSTASVDGFTYASFAPAPYATSSRVLGSGPPGGSYEADELVCADASSCHSSDLFGIDIFGIPYTSTGLPDFSANPQGWSGEFATGPMAVSPNYLQFHIVSLAPAAVPEPAPWILLTLGFAGIALARRRTAAAR